MYHSKPELHPDLLVQNELHVLQHLQRERGLSDRCNECERLQVFLNCPNLTITILKLCKLELVFKAYTSKRAAVSALLLKCLPVCVLV